MENNNKKRWRKVLFGVLVLIGILLFMGIMIFRHYYTLLDIQVEQENTELVSHELLQEDIEDAFMKMEAEENVDEEQTDEAEMLEENFFQDIEISGEEAFNIMLLGIDSRNDDYSGRTDAMILFSINPDTKKAVMTSFLRDMYVNIPGYGGNRLNTAYALGGTNLLSKTISNNFGIEIDDFVLVNFALVMDVVDAFHGVEIGIETEEIEYLNGYLKEHNRLLNNPEKTDYLTTDDVGTRLLNGSQALAYARIRYVGTDFGRTSRQREIISVLLNKMKDMNIKEINNLLEQFLPRVRTNLSQKDLATLLFMSLGIKDYTIESMAIPVDNTWKYSQIRGMSVIEVDFKANAKAWYDTIKE